MFSIGLFIQAVLFGLALAMDCFTVSIVCGIQKTLTIRRGLFMALCFGFFQGLMPLLGGLLGDIFKSVMDEMAPWVAFALLFVIGLKMIKDARSFTIKEKVFDVSSLKVILLLSIATSIDAFIVGVGFAMTMNLFQQMITCIIVCVVTFIMSVIGWRMGERAWFIRPRMALSAGGIILILIGLKAILEHYLPMYL